MVKPITVQEKRYIHLSLHEREEIAIGLVQGLSIRSIASTLGRKPSSVCREISRNSPLLNNVTYRGNRAQRRAEDRSRRSHNKEHLASPFVKSYVKYHLVHDGWSPQAIPGRLSPEFPQFKTNYESIYQWIYSERRDLIKHLVKGHKKRQKRSSGKKSRVSRIPNRINITERPEPVETGAQAGHKVYPSTGVSCAA